MSRIIDLTMEITDAMAVYPGDDAVRLFQTKFYDKDGYTNHRLETGMHIGTHMDAPMHMTNSNITVADIPLENLIGKGVLINAEGDMLIDNLEKYDASIDGESIVLIHTGYSKHFGTQRYFEEHPIISEPLAELFVRKKIKALCIDCPSPDRYPFRIHKLLLENGITIVENCVNLDSLEDEKSYEVFIVPLNIKTDGCMVRVFTRSY